ncbi:MAG: sulfite exporter TauE/SafE family protein, partial [Desulfuromonadales bacterium]|nr:sulfite exporter TauE/SafE family protein [Desulfuromonadales bacterium]
MDFLTPTLLSMTVVLAACAGLLAGLLGIGGGVILVPFFLWLFKEAGMPPQLIVHSAFGTSLCIIMPTAISSTLGHLRRRNVDWHQVFYLDLGGGFGALLGSSLAAMLSGNILRAFFGVMQIAIGLKMLITPAQRDLASRL